MDEYPNLVDVSVLTMTDLRDPSTLLRNLGGYESLRVHGVHDVQRHGSSLHRSRTHMPHRGVSAAEEPQFQIQFTVVCTKRGDGTYSLNSPYTSLNCRPFLSIPSCPLPQRNYPKFPSSSTPTIVMTQTLAYLHPSNVPHVH